MSPDSFLAKKTESDFMPIYEAQFQLQASEFSKVMANTVSLPLYERVIRKNTLQRALDITILLLLFSLLVYRLLHVDSHGRAWLLALLCESWFTFIWVLTTSTKWTLVEYKTYPDHLLKRYFELPPVDMFVTTTDPILEPPIITINTVISLLAVDYPAYKLACYVSDDGSSPLTFYSLIEASKFAKFWVPFCKKYNVQVRAPFRYFLDDSVLSSATNSLEFQQEWQMLKDEYMKLSGKIESAEKESTLCDLTSELPDFSNIQQGNHPTIIKVILDNKEDDPDNLPRLVYISREKRPNNPHHSKAGAMNVLARVSGVMTNAPFMLNVDCDMFVNNPQIVLHAMCFLQGTEKEKDSGFVQCPQAYYDGLKDDPFGNQAVVLHEYMGRGMVGIQGPIYDGTGCFHRRKIIYGLLPDEVENEAKEELIQELGNSKEFIKSATCAIKERTDYPYSNLLNPVQAAYQVASCGYEHGTIWGTKVGWLYGSMNEDVLTGLEIHKKGWRSVYCTPNPPAFLGCTPSGGPASMTQQKRWATGLLEVLLSKSNPIFGTLTGKLQFRQCLAYMWILIWGLRSIPELCYTVLPAYCIINNSNFLPMVQDSGTYIFIAIFVMYPLYTLTEYIRISLSIRNWWNNQRMARITTTSAWLFAVLSTILKPLRQHETVFEVTHKDQSNSSNDDAGVSKFSFDESPMFIPGTTIVILQLAALALVLLGLQKPVSDGVEGSGLGEVVCSLLVVLFYWPFVRGLFGRGKYGIPFKTICNSVALALIFCALV